MSAETEALKIVAGLMALAALTAPKAVGLDSTTRDRHEQPCLKKARPCMLTRNTAPTRGSTAETECG
jgi:uncharacterized ferredoxin-like protein